MNWHTRYAQQARWTRELRSYLFHKAGLQRARRVLEVGCGTGAVLSGLRGSPGVHGLDIQLESLEQCRLHAPEALLLQGDALQLPYTGGVFDIVYSHFLLLWVRDPVQALLEMKRVTLPGGAVIAFAEPDYLRRVDRPEALAALGQAQTEALVRQGADPGIGARLAELFQAAGIPVQETGSLQSQDRQPSREEEELEWQVLEADLRGIVPQIELQEMRRLDTASRQRGDRVLHVPTHFAWGRV